MSEIKDGGQAFPRAGYEHASSVDGMSLRDYFAAKAMQARVFDYRQNEDEVAEWAYRRADAMLKAREGK
jgi:hypothetical protein